MKRITFISLVAFSLLISDAAISSELGAIEKLKVSREIPNLQGGVTYISTAPISELQAHYKNALGNLGWSVADESTDGKSFGNANFTRGGEILAFTMGANTAAVPPTVMVSLVPVGSISSASLPYYPAAEALYTSPATSIYVTADEVSAVAQKTAELLKDDGWVGKLQPAGASRQFMTLNKAESVLSVTIQVAPAQGNKTSIQYGMAKAK